MSAGLFAAKKTARSSHAYTLHKTMPCCQCYIVHCQIGPNHPKCAQAQDRPMIVDLSKAATT